MIRHVLVSGKSRIIASGICSLFRGIAFPGRSKREIKVTGTSHRPRCGFHRVTKKPRSLMRQVRIAARGSLDRIAIQERFQHKSPCTSSALRSRVRIDRARLPHSNRPRDRGTAGGAREPSKPSSDLQGMLVPSPQYPKGPAPSAVRTRDTSVSEDEVFSPTGRQIENSIQ